MQVEEFENLLKSLRSNKSKKQMEDWNRSLPFEEELFDRWERARSLGFGERTSIYQSALVFGDVQVGSDTWIGPYTILDGSGGLVIGDNCSISSGVQIYTHDTVAKRISNGREGIQRERTTIGNSCYIGPQSVIRKGVHIGNNVVVGVQSYVNKNVEPFTIVGGTPAKVIGRVEIDNEGQVSFLLDRPESIHVLSQEVSELKARIQKLELAINRQKKGKNEG